MAHLLIHNTGAWLNLIRPQLSGAQGRRTVGWPILDAKLADVGDVTSERGILVPALVVLGAEPKAGKSQWAQIVATHRAEQGDITLYVDLENGVARHIRRLLCRRSEVGPNILRGVMGGQGATSDILKVAEAERWLTAMSTYYLTDDRSISADLLDTICAGIREAQPEARITLVMDSLQRLPAGGGNDGRRSEIEHWVGALEGIRDRYQCLIVVISELSRPPVGTKSSAAHRYKETGRIEYAADVSLSLSESGVMRIEYNRDGETGDVARYELVRPHFGMREIPLGLPKKASQESEPG